MSARLSRRMLKVLSLLVCARATCALQLPGGSGSSRRGGFQAVRSRSGGLLYAASPGSFRGSLGVGRLGASGQSGRLLAGGRTEELASSWTGVGGALFRLNASTKWLVTIAHTTAVWRPPKSFYPPFIVVGSILGAFLTEALKALINQSRPADAPFADPGMPSSHSLVSCFAAAAWIVRVGGWRERPAVCAALAGAASIVAGLRVVCRFHTKRQVLVGAALGAALGRGWMVLGDAAMAADARLALAFAWASYLGCSALFIGRYMRSWVAKDRNL